MNLQESKLTPFPCTATQKPPSRRCFPTSSRPGPETVPSPAEAVTAARNLIAYYDIRLKEPQYPVLEAIQNGIPEYAFIVWDVTQFGYYARTHYKVKHPKTYIDSGYSIQSRLRVPNGAWRRRWQSQTAR